MKTYPSIPREPAAKAQHYYAFDKLDGSNIRAEWSRKDGIHKYGRRNGLLDDSNPILKRAIPDVEAVRVLPRRPVPRGEDSEGDGLL